MGRIQNSLSSQECIPGALGLSRRELACRRKVSPLPAASIALGFAEIVAQGSTIPLQFAAVAELTFED